MPRWKALSEELDPQVREFAGQLRRLVDRRGLSIAAVADRTGCSRTSWERYLNGRLLAPKGAVVALAEATGTSQAHLTTMWELAERAWSRSEPRQDMTVLSVRIPGTGDTGGAGGTGGAGDTSGEGISPGDPAASLRSTGRRRRQAVLLAGVVGALLVLAAVVLPAGPGH
ncbi:MULTISPECIES: helix-turn-helix transcriptional regulator [unclassified Streptomyces]|uniref:helix-turn-helix domain-containing protein n=3 Tax=Streptomyces TaxID=1883 RepID=UPI002B1DAC48|nr:MULTISPECIES: helix-turn-helix transcriptional regulator [unclassified Streptomyces]